MNVKTLFVFIFSLLGVVLLSVGLYNTFAPLIPFGSLGMMIIGLVIILLVGFIGGKKLIQ